MDQQTIKKMPVKNSNESANKVSASDTDPKRLVFSRVIDATPPKDEAKRKKFLASKQWTKFLGYKYPGASSGADGSKPSDGEHLQILTPVVDFKSGVTGVFPGMPGYNEEYHKSKAEAARFLIPLGWVDDDKNDEKPLGGKGALELRECLKKFDKKFGNEIKEDPDSFIAVKESGKESFLKALGYNDLVKESTEPNKPSEDWAPWYRCNVKIPTKGDPMEPVTAVSMAVPDPTSNDPDNEKFFVATSLDEISEYFKIGCQAQFILKMEQFYVLKSKNKDTKKFQCGFKLTCDMIRIVKLSDRAGGKKESKNWSLYIGNDKANAHNDDASDNDDNEAQTKTNKQTSDASEDSDVKPRKKKVVASDDDSDEDVKPRKKKAVAVSDSDEEVKPRKKKAVVSDDDSDEETKKPAKKSSSKSKPKKK
jgi:hypothetical protein